MNAYYIANAVKSSKLALAANIKTNIAQPVYADNAAAIINPNYEIPEKEPFNPDKDASKIWTNINGTTGDTANAQAQYKWYGTVLGKNTVPSNYVITQVQRADLHSWLKKLQTRARLKALTTA